MKKVEKSAEQRAQEAKLEETLRAQAECDVDEQLKREGKVNPISIPTKFGVDLDALRVYEETRNSRIIVKLNELRVEHGIAVVKEQKKHNPRCAEPQKTYKPAHDWRNEVYD